MKTDTHCALVTGASSGLGETFARQLAKKGYGLVLVARRKGHLDALAQETASAHGVKAEVIAADLSQDAGVSAVEKRIASGDIGFLVNCAGFGTIGEFVSLPLGRELEEIDLNVRALVRLSHAALGPMTARGRGTVINVASTGAFQPVPNMATYAATKAFVLSFSEALHEEVKKRGVTVTCLCPGPVKTSFQQAAGMDESRLPGIGWISPEVVVHTALRAAAAGRAVVVPGALNGAAAMGVRFIPRFAARQIAGSLFKDLRA